MYLANLLIRNFRQFGKGDHELNIAFEKGITGLVGRNDGGKSAVIDAIRYALLTRDQSYVRVQQEDFHIESSEHQTDEIFIRCELKDLSEREKGTFLEYLSYDRSEAFLVVNWVALKRSDSPYARRWVDVSVRSGAKGAGPAYEMSVRELLSTAYLRPLRDAAREMSSGRGSRLSQILGNVPGITEGASFDKSQLPKSFGEVNSLSLLGLADYFSHRIKNHERIGEAEEAVNSQYLSSLFLSGDNLRGSIDLTEGGSDALRLRQILERLELGLLEKSTGVAHGQYGLGSNNLLYMACELLLLGREFEGLPLLLIEEPEAHLHPQRQLRLMEFLSKASRGEVEHSPRPVQILLSTHSPNLASMIPLENLVILEEGRAYPLAKGDTKLASGDYGFLERFLDVTKANLFFAHGIIIVEGDAEALIIPTFAKILGMDLTEYGVSVINVRGTGLRRFSRIFQRNDGMPVMSVRVACVTDMDVMPDCAPAILGLVDGDHDSKWTNPRRRWLAERDLKEAEKPIAESLSQRRSKLCSDDEQEVKTFVSANWTLEYDLAFSGLEKEVYIAAVLAQKDSDIHEKKEVAEDVRRKACNDFQKLEASTVDRSELCSHIYKIFHSGGASKAIAAQYLAAMVSEYAQKGDFDQNAFAKKLPAHLVQAISHATTVGTPR